MVLRTFPIPFLVTEIAFTSYQISFAIRHFNHITFHPDLLSIED